MCGRPASTISGKCSESRLVSARQGEPPGMAALHVEVKVCEARVDPPPHELLTDVCLHVPRPRTHISRPATGSSAAIAGAEPDKITTRTKRRRSRPSVWRSTVLAPSVTAASGPPNRRRHRSAVRLPVCADGVPVAGDDACDSRASAVGLGEFMSIAERAQALPGVQLRIGCQRTSSGRLL